MEDDDLEGEWILGWPGRKRLSHFASTDQKGRVTYAQSPILEQEAFSHRRPRRGVDHGTTGLAEMEGISGR